MSNPTYCPQCQAPLKVPAGLAADKSIICPECRLKFVPPVSDAPMGDAPAASEAPASYLGLILLVLGIVIFAGAIGVWSLLNRSDPAITSAAGDNAPGGDDELSKLTAKLKSDSSESKATGETSATPPIPAPTPSKPEVPQPIKKAPKTYAETKRPEENPSTPVIAVEAGVAQQQQVNEAIDRGVAYLKAAQYPTGTWSKNPDNAPQTYSVGYAALGGLTLLECQVPAADPAVQKAAAFVRTTQITDRLHRNYQMACAILFLDRLGDPQDRTLIQNYALHLVAGQTARGGWQYDSPDLSDVELQQLFNFLEATRIPVADLKSTLDKKVNGAGEPAQPAAKKPPAKKAVAKVPPAQTLSRQVLAIPIVYLHYFPKGTPPAPVQRDMLVGLMPEDNSNAQFALLALWTARRHGIPTERCLIAAAQKFATSQNHDGGWGYTGSGGLVQITNSTPAMTAVGLLGLAMGYAVVPAAPPTGKLPEQPAIANALTKLGKHIDADDMKNFYFLWSVERVAMLYNLKTIGSRDWYDVGAKMLLSTQQKEGSWSMQRYSGSTPPLDTCFALLFLKRSNLVQDLSDRLPFLMAIRDPGGPPER